jgi:phosphoribosylformylglycinamidine synthase
MMKAKVIVMPKAAVLDPQGNAVRDAMRHLGMPEVRSVRIGKYMEIDIDGQNGDFESRLHRLCRDLLSNPVIEDYELQKSEDRNHRKTPNAQRRTRLRSPRRPTARQASNSDKSRAGVQYPKSKTKRTRLRPTTARQARKSP